MEEIIKNKLTLKQGEVLKLIDHRMKGSLQETDVYNYDIVDESGLKVGSVEYTHHTAIKGFKVTQTMTQKTLDGEIVNNERW
ncbi:hypothetical protein [Alteromonas gracilis]|uniref:hypothetical protein n=1 Tax=Alteromonas gracilis TaxID=1479524 RepID=UPI0037354483